MSHASPFLIPVPFDALPDTAEVTGRVIRQPRPQFRGEHCPDQTVLTFERRKLGDVRDDLKGKAYTKVEITDIKFA